MGYADRIRKAAEKRIIYTQHALDEITAPDELITTAEIRYTILSGEIIEEYPADRRGHSFLLVARPDDKRVVHVVCAPKEEYLAIITAYVPSAEKWEADFKTRRKR